jgi:hypothetical protein
MDGNCQQIDAIHAQAAARGVTVTILIDVVCVLDPPPAPGDPLPAADVLVVTWTIAETEALADVFTPGQPRSPAPTPAAASPTNKEHGWPRK